MNHAPSSDSASELCAVSLGLQHWVSGQPVTNDQSDGFGTRNVMLGNKLIDARQYVGLETGHDWRADRSAISPQIWKEAYEDRAFAQL